MTKQVTLSVGDSLKKLRDQLTELAPRIEGQINSAVKDAAYAVYASIMAKAQKELHSTRQAYLDALHFEDLGDNSFLISLDGDWANKLEDGFGSYDMTAMLLKSSKMVEVGKRAGQPWVQNSKERPGNPSHKFAHVPMAKQPFSKASNTADMAAAIRQMSGSGINGVTQNITKLFKDSSGSPLEGKVAIGKSDNSKLDGLVKYQKTYKNGDKSTTKSIYINYRTISETGKPWINKGFSGLKAFAEAEQELVKNIDAIIKSLI